MLNHVRAYFLQRPWLFTILLVSLLVRIPFLDDAFLLRGERDILLTGESLLHTSKDLYQNYLPLQFSGLDQPSPPLTFYSAAVLDVLFPLRSVFWGRFAFLMLASLNTLLIYDFIRVFSNKKSTALLTTTLFSLSPGYFHTSMLALEMSLAFPLLLAGLVAYVSKRRVLGWGLLVTAGLAYNGFRPVVPFLMIYAQVWFWLEHRSWRRFVQECFFIVVVYGLIFGATVQLLDGDIVRSRGADIAFVNYQDITPRVDFRRATTLVSPQIAQVFDNKITETIRYMKDVFFEGQGIHYLFVKGDQAALYATTFTGQFFSIFAVAYYLGFVALGLHKDIKKWYMLGWIPLALIPSVMNVDYVSVTNRSMLTSVGFAYLMTLGLQMGGAYVKKTSTVLRWSLIGICLLVLSIEVGYFTYNYTYRRPVTMFESFFEHERQIAQFLVDHPKTTLYDPSPKNVITTLAFIDPSLPIESIQKALTSLRNNPAKVSIGSHVTHVCPQSGKKDVMYRPGVVISEACLDPDEYAALEYTSLQNRLLYKDFSKRTAYFIFSAPLEKPTEK